MTFNTNPENRKELALGTFLFPRQSDLDGNSEETIDLENAEGSTGWLCANPAVFISRSSSCVKVQQFGMTFTEGKALLAGLGFENASDGNHCTLVWQRWTEQMRT